MKQFRASLIVLAVALFACWPLAAVAQDHGEPSANTPALHDDEVAGDHGDNNPHGEDNHNHGEGDHGEGDHAEGDHGEGHADNSPHWNELISAIINFSIYMGLIFVFARKPILNYFEARRTSVSENIEQAAKLRAEAEVALAELEEKMKGFDAERAAILAEYREIGEHERAKIIEVATADAAKILKEAALRVEQEQRSAKARLKGDLVTRALSSARVEVDKQLTPDLHRRLIDSTISELSSNSSMRA